MFTSLIDNEQSFSTMNTLTNLSDNETTDNETTDCEAPVAAQEMEMDDCIRSVHFEGEGLFYGA